MTPAYRNFTTTPYLKANALQELTDLPVEPVPSGYIVTLFKEVPDIDAINSIKGIPMHYDKVRETVYAICSTPLGVLELAEAFKDVVEKAKPF